MVREDVTEIRKDFSPSLQFRPIRAYFCTLFLIPWTDIEGGSVTGRVFEASGCCVTRKSWEAHELFNNLFLLLVL